MTDLFADAAKEAQERVARRKRLRAFYTTRMAASLPPDWAIQDAYGTIIARSYANDDPIEAMLNANFDYDEANDTLWQRLS